MRVFSIFSGAGGFDLACRNKGHVIVGACEIEAHPRGVYARAFPGVENHPDATKIEPRLLPDIDAVVAGSPCQDFSIEGTRAGLQGARGSLFFAFIRILKTKRPRNFMFENVPGILSSDGGKAMQAILNVLDGVGYDTEWCLVDAAGETAQSRKRMFIVGHLRT